jgi:SAM-dependent methyltransferase
MLIDGRDHSDHGGDHDGGHDDGHGRGSPSGWVERFASLAPAGLVVLDIACGSGRHTRLFLDRGHEVVALDRDVSGLDDLDGSPGLEAVEVDLEDGTPLPVLGRRFGAVVVTNYLYRPLLRDLLSLVAPRGGILIYETFSAGNERFGRPTRPDFLLKPGELLDLVRGQLHVVAYEDVVVSEPRPAAVQRIVATRG